MYNHSEKQFPLTNRRDFLREGRTRHGRRRAVCGALCPRGGRAWRHARDARRAAAVRRRLRRAQQGRADQRRQSHRQYLSGLEVAGQGDRPVHRQSPGGDQAQQRFHGQPTCRHARRCSDRHFGVSQVHREARQRHHCRVFRSAAPSRASRTLATRRWRTSTRSNWWIWTRRNSRRSWRSTRATRSRIRCGCQASWPIRRTTSSFRRACSRPTTLPSPPCPSRTSSSARR